jgi:hypothetical protein
MMADSLDEQDEETWQILVKLVPALEVTGMAQHIDLTEVLRPPIHERLATCFLRVNREQGLAKFLTDDQVFQIAAEEMEPVRARFETDIDEAPGIYVFVSLFEKQILKVGQAINLRERIAKGHLRYGNQQSDSNLIDYCKSRWDTWPQWLREQEVTLLMFPLYKSIPEERCFLEFGLQKLLRPLMP